MSEVPKARAVAGALALALTAAATAGWAQAASAYDRSQTIRFPV